MAYDKGELDLQARIQIRLTNVVPPEDYPVPEDWQPGQPLRMETTLGRCIFNETLPADFPFVNYGVGKKQLSVIVNSLAETYPKVQVAAALDALKDAGFHWATRSGVTIGIEDVVAPPNKAAILDGYERRADKVQREYERGLITDDERRQELIEIWTHATAEVAQDMENAFPATNPVWMMVNSGARGNPMQVRQIAGMRGLVSNPKGVPVTDQAVLLLAHIDVVEAKREDWTRDPFTLVEENGNFYARGASDDKAEAAIWVDTLVRYREENFRPLRTIKLALTCGEETAGAFNGAQWLTQNRRELIDAEFALNEGASGELDAEGNRVALRDPGRREIPAELPPGGHQPGRPQLAPGEGQRDLPARGGADAHRAATSSRRSSPMATAPTSRAWPRSRPPRATPKRPTR